MLSDFLSLGETAVVCISAFVGCVFFEMILRRIIPIRNIPVGGLGIIGFAQLSLIGIVDTKNFAIFIIALSIPTSAVLSYKIISKVEANIWRKTLWSVTFIGWNGFSFVAHFLLQFLVLVALHNAFTDG